MGYTTKVVTEVANTAMELEVHPSHRGPDY